MQPSTSTQSEILFAPTGFDFEGVFRFLYEHLTGRGLDSLLESVSFWWNVYSVIAVLISLLFFVGFIYARIRFGQLSAIETDAILHAEELWAIRHQAKGSKNAGWDTIQKRVTENNPESWRIAIIEADIMLDETLTQAGYVGKSIGEKLKTANPHSFTTVQDAWNAHKVRNDIAHVGSDFILTNKTAKDTLLQYERVFKEFGII